MDQLSVANKGCASTVKMPKSTVRSKCGPVAANCDCNLGRQTVSRGISFPAGGTSTIGPVALSRYSLADLQPVLVGLTAGGTIADTN